MIERDGTDGIVTLRLAHGKASALDLELLKALEEELEAASEARAVVLTGSGSIFSAGVDLFRLVDEGHEEARVLIPQVLFIIMGTILIYGLTAPLLARLLKLVREHPQGVIMVGAHTWARLMAQSLQTFNIKVVLIDRNPWNIHHAQKAGLPTMYSNILAADATRVMWDFFAGR